ncbi:hypothetical protein BRL93_22655 [Xanthomonas oryzae pv. oryzae]|nr:hypothetical protein BRL93_22655 [Xanthomonas oryzae pv. oryzae]
MTIMVLRYGVGSGLIGKASSRRGALLRKHICGGSDGDVWRVMWWFGVIEPALIAPGVLLLPLCYK